MFPKISDLKNMVLQATDGAIGRCDDFLFDDRHWAIRYMVADTRKWLPGRKVLISPISLGEPNWEDKQLPVKLARAQIKDGPALETDMPVSRRYEMQWFDHYGWPYYWVGPDIWGNVAHPAGLYKQVNREAMPAQRNDMDIHLRSTEEVTGYGIQATDGEIGHVEDFLVDDETWVLRYVVVDTRKWLPGRNVLISPQWVREVKWADRKIAVNMNIQRVKDSPEYDASSPLSRQDDNRFRKYFKSLFE